ncbi:hypothetical protein F4810DRAFT_677305 [Camillea tinctor]|nr:hypothetical protein F4810DRAFT_677305 [Camillea tinctor]
MRIRAIPLLWAVLNPISADSAADKSSSFFGSWTIVRCRVCCPVYQLVRSQIFGEDSLSLLRSYSTRSSHSS